MNGIENHKQRLPRTIDELLTTQAIALGEQPVLAYPAKDASFIDYTLKNLDALACQAAHEYSRQGLKPRQSSSDDPLIVALLGVSDIDYVVTLLAVSKLGHAVLLLSPRLALPAYEWLLTETKSSHIIYQPTYTPMVTKIQTSLPNTTLLPISHPALGQTQDSNTLLTPGLDLTAEQDKTAWIFHSSGSTGLPKPVRISHRGALSNYRRNIDRLNMRSYLSLPLFHTHGISTLFRAFYTGKQVHMYNATLPLTKGTLVQSMQGLELEIFCAVPYAFKLLAESPEGIELLRRFRLVTYGGSACPEALGDMLAEKGVNLVSVYGMSELGPVMTSSRPPWDKEWNYLRPSPEGSSLLRFEDRGEGLFELVCLDGWPSKSMSNRPDGSYATKDLFVKHPTLTDAWKYVGRLDDVIVLENGEKANPIPIEGRVRQHELVAEAVVFGTQKPQFGIAIVPSDAASGMESQEVILKIGDALKESQQSMPDYARINEDMVLVLPVGTEYPRTDKGTVIRQAFYKKFRDQIDESYKTRETIAGPALSESELREFLRSAVVTLLDETSDIPDDRDFFEMGFDSLKATQLRNVIARSVNVGGQALGTNLVFDHPQIQSLARHLYSLRTGEQVDSDDLASRMEAMIKANTPEISAWESVNGIKEYPVVTGTTGSLGAHLVSQLAQSQDVQKVYCLIRAENSDGASDRLVQSLKERGLWDDLPLEARNKLVALSADLSSEALGLDSQTLSEMRWRMTSLYHCAWKVNFNLKLESFERDSIRGLKNLLSLCLATGGRRPPRFCFCSSIGTVLRTKNSIIREDLPTSFSDAQPTGYGQSKLVAEHICARVTAESGLPIYIARIGQIVGDTRHGIWNRSEAVPLMIQSARAIGALPTIDEHLRWLPVDVAARCLIDITTSGAKPGVFNVVNPKTLHWTRDVLPALRKQGLLVDEVSPPEWLQRLREANEDPVKNPAIRLLEYYTSQYSTDAPKRSFDFAVSKTEEASETFRRVRAPEEALLARIVAYIQGSPRERTD